MPGNKTVPTPEKSPALKFLYETVDVSRPYFGIMMLHGHLVAAKALAGARNIQDSKPDLAFIYEASLLHDLGMFYTDAPAIDCQGKLPYLRHGVIGAGLLKKAGFHRHARVCETHVGVCISKEDVKKNDLPLPEKNYFPETIEEKCIAWADKFYSKIPGKIHIEKDIENIKRGIRKYGAEKLSQFMEWQLLFADQESK